MNLQKKINRKIIILPPLIMVMIGFICAMIEISLNTKFVSATYGYVFSCSSLLLMFSTVLLIISDAKNKRKEKNIF